MNKNTGPTLLRKGFLETVERDGILYSPTKNSLDDHVPIEYIMTKISQKKSSTNSAADRIFLLDSSTGSGKSTIIPPEFYHRFFEDLGSRNICCTQPRVLTSIDIPNTIIKFHTKEALTKAGYPSRKPLILGQNIGYQTGSISKRPVRGLIYMTIQVLTQQMNIMSDEDFMKRYSAIFIDEVHERSVATDYALFAIKKFVARNYKNKNCPFIFTMSATFNTWKMADYLLEDNPKRYENIIKIRGFTYEIQHHFLDYDTQNYIQSSVECVRKIHKDNPKDFGSDGLLLKKHNKGNQYRDILIFVSGAADIRKIKKKLQQLNSADEYFKKYPIIPVEITSETVKSGQKEIFEDLEKLFVEVQTGNSLEIKKPLRRVFIATNVAETGITIHTLRYVIDTGWFKSSEFEPNFAVNMLVTKPITKSMSIQRGGRAGREYPGVVYYMYTKNSFDSMIADQYPDIIKNEISLDLLSLLIYEADPENIFNTMSCREFFENKTIWEKINKKNIDITTLDLLDLPSADSLHYSMEKLFILGAINSNSIPTNIGFLMNRFRFVSIESIKMILSGFAWGVCITDLINIAAMLETGTKNIFLDNWKGEEKNRYLIADDFIESALVFKKFQDYLGSMESYTDTPEIQKWAESNGLSITGLYRVIEIREEIISSLAMMGLSPYKNISNSITNSIDIEIVKLIKQCIFEGFKMNIAVWNPIEKKYITRKSHIPINLLKGAGGDVISSNMELVKYGDTNPRYIIYHKLLCSPDPRGALYQIEADAISILDGYIPLDINFDSLV
jgi:HrpA-like RNA helicase